MRHQSRTSRIIIFAAFVAAIVTASSCGGDTTTPKLGPLKLGIVSGNDQTVAAGRPQLGAPVVGKMVRAADGTVSFRFLDALLPAVANAQGVTVVNGSPVPGAVVCAVSADTLHKLIPFTPCTNTDANGTATFFFSTGTVAGVSKAEIRGTIDAQPAVFDTARATVLADTIINVFIVNSNNDLGTLHVGDTIRLQNIITRVEDKYKNTQADWTAVWGFTTDSISNCCFPPMPALNGSGFLPVVTQGARTLFVRVGPVAVQPFKLRTIP